MMVCVRFFFLLLLSSLATPSFAEDDTNAYKTHIHFENGVVYCDVQTFQQEAYILKVLGGGSAITVVWQFDVLLQRDFWLNTPVAMVRLGRQVISDLVTKRWMMRDLNSGVVHYTTNVQVAMRFLVELRHAAVVDISVLDAQSEYVLATTFFLHEGESAEKSWWVSLVDWGENMGEIRFDMQSSPPGERQ